MTTYFDIVDRVLEGAGLTLRVRRIGNTYIQTVKSRANGRGVATDRGEWEWQFDQNVLDIAKLSQTRGLPIVARAVRGKLEPVFITDIRRTVHLLHLPGDTLVEVVIDEGSIVAGSAHEPVCELELELKRGGIGPVYQLATELQGLAPMWISPQSKSARGWHLRTGQTADAQEVSIPKLVRRARAVNGFHSIIGATLGHLVANIEPTLHGDAEGLHQMRKALRCCRAALKLFETHLDQVATGRFNAELIRFGGIFGAARDWDIFCLKSLASAATDLQPGQVQALNVAAEVERRVANATVRDTVRAQGLTALILHLAAWSEAGIAQPSTIGSSPSRCEPAR